MCGIAGIVVSSDELVPIELMRTMGQTQSHRGPDNFSTLVRENFGFAHNRLSILDLTTAGNQPFSDDRFVLVYNGEIYNYVELRMELCELGIQVRGTSDTAVLFEYLKCFGVEDTLRRIEGMFAFSFCDLREETVYLCRDRLGIKPLVWSYSGTMFCWASEIKALAAVTNVKPDPIRTLYSAASTGDHSNEYTVFDKVKQVPPGCYISFNPTSHPKTIQYYDILEEIDEAYYRELSGMTAEVVTRRFSDILRRSVESMLMSDTPMGAFVSGGIDSSLIASLAAEHDPALSLFTANVVGKYSEFADAELLSQSLDKQLHAARFSPEMMLTELARATFHYEVPIVTHTNAVPFSTVACLARQRGVKAVLTGEGSDELFLGYPKLIADRYKQYLRAPIELLKAVYGVVPGLKEYLYPNYSESIDGFFNLLVQGFERQRLREKGYEALGFLPEGKISHQYLTIQMIREGLIALLHRNDRMGMQASIESRFPFLDEEMVSFAINLPVKFKTARSWRSHNYKHPFFVDKAIVRWAARSRLPEKLVQKPKNGFPMYGHQHMRVKEGYFYDGYVAGLLQLTPTVLEYLIRTQPSYFVAKLVSVDIFGRLFDFDQTIEQVTDNLLAHVTIES